MNEKTNKKIDKKNKKKQKKITRFRKEFVTIETADKIKIEYKIATPLLRFASFTVDYLIFFIIMLIIIYVINYLQILNYFSKLFNEKIFEALLYFFYFVIYFILLWFYYFFFEVFLNGKTLGKLIFRLRTIHYQGKYLDITNIVLRNFIRIFDQYPLFFIPYFNFIPLPIPALISMLVNKDSRRIGDIVGNTIVIKEEKLLTKTPDFTIKSIINFDVQDNKILVKKLNENDLYILRKFLNSINTFPETKRKDLTEKMAKTIRKKIHDSEEYTDPLEYLKRVYMRHNDEY